MRRLVAAVALVVVAVTPAAAAATPELVVNGTFDESLAGWMIASFGSGPVWSGVQGGVARLPASTDVLRQRIPVVAGQPHTFQVRNGSALGHFLRVYIGSSEDGIDLVFALIGPGLKTYTVTSPTALISIYLQAATAEVLVDDVSLKPLP